MRRPTAEIVLASASPRRVELLASAGIVVNVVPSGIPEELRPGETPDEHVRRLAAEKVRAVAASHPGRFFIGADTVVVLDGEVLGKPRDAADAERMLRRLSGEVHDVITGYAVYDAAVGRIHVEAVTTRVCFRSLGDEEIAAYVAAERPFDKAGAYAIQGRAAGMVRRIEGSYTNIVGLPLCETLETLARMGAISPCGGSKPN